MTRRLSSVAVEFVAAEARVRSEFDCPVLIWEAASLAGYASFDTQGSGLAGGPEEGDALIFPVRKRPRKVDAFPLGVTLGSASNCDIVLPHDSVSALHAYVVEADGKWTLVDADSKSGVLLSGVRLERRVATPLPGGAPLKLGDLTLQFLLPEGLMEYLASLV